VSAPSPPWLVETGADLARLAERLSGEPRLALDTEADSLHRYRERVCVVQVSVPGLDAIVDPLAVPDLSPLRALVAEGSREVVLHGGDYDVSILSRDHAFRFSRVFDTMVAATLLGEEKVGLQALVEAAFGVRLSKKLQTADWGRRPLTPEHTDYLRGDTAHLLGLRDLLAGRLRDADLVEESEIEFRRLAARRGSEPGDEPEPWRRVKGADRLDARGRAVLAAAWAWREGAAKAHDVPRFRVLHDDSLVALATSPPADEAAVAALPGGATVRRVGDAPALLETVARGLAAAARGEAPPPPERPRRTPEERAQADAVRKREERVRAWRKDEAARRKVPNVVVLPNPALRALCEAPPSSVEEIARNPDVGPKRVALYGAKLLELLKP
jgi:ribonuclease D